MQAAALCAQRERERWRGSRNEFVELPFFSFFHRLLLLMLAEPKKKEAGRERKSEEHKIRHCFCTQRKSGKKRRKKEREG